MNQHSNPTEKHQLATLTLTMSKFGEDFKTCGAFVELPSREKVYTDQKTDVGDLLLFNATTPHGVSMSDPNESTDWLIGNYLKVCHIC